MRSLIDALLSFSRVTTKAQPFSAVDLAETAEEVVSDLEDRLERMNGRLEIGPLPSLEADPLQMRQLLQNLIGNGLKFARPETPPVVKVESRLLDPAGRNGDGPLRALPRAVACAPTRSRFSSEVGLNLVPFWPDLFARSVSSPLSGADHSAHRQR
ncbi:hypothetical protein BH20VER3_BH20VER3_17250 [soil metagenome]